MCVNRDMNMAVVRPTQAYLKKTNFIFSYRIGARNQLMSQLFPNSRERTEQPDLIDNSPTTRRWDENVMKCVP